MCTHHHGTHQEGIDEDDKAERMLDEQLEQWQLLRDRIDAGMPLHEDTMRPPPAPDAWGGQNSAQEDTEEAVDEEAPVVVCTRCYALRHYG